MSHYINHNIKFWRQYKRYTQTDVADILLTTVGRIKQYEKITYPPAEMIIKIADMMNISLDTLFKTKLTQANYGKEESRIEALEKRLKRLEKTVK